MRRVIVSACTDPEAAAVLAAHLAAQKPAFDEWRLWVNTDSPEAREGLAALAGAHEWASVVDPEGSYPAAGALNLHKFYPTAADPGEAYVRLDDDVVWLAPGFVDALFSAREASRDFLVFANAVNDAALARVHERLGAFASPVGRAEHAWTSAAFGRDVHEAFLADAAAGPGAAAARWGFPAWKLLDREVVSPGAAAWLGADLAPVGGRVPMDLAPWLCATRPAQTGARTSVCGAALCARLWPEGQAPVDRALLARYAALAPRADDPPKKPEAVPEASTEPATPAPAPEPAPGVEAAPEVVERTPSPPPAAPEPEPPAAPKKRRAPTRRTASVVSVA